jgi:energy-coupling factor transporter ATP-binding protein EcfA2
MKNQSFDSNNTNEMFKFFCQSINDQLSPFLLSEGEKRRLSISLTLMLQKPVVIYDEPTFGQDEHSKEWIVELMKWQQSLGRIQIFISHDVGFINKVASKVYELRDGKLVYVQ